MINDYKFELEDFSDEILVNMYRHSSLDDLVKLFATNRRMRSIAIEVVRNHMSTKEKEKSLTQEIYNRNISGVRLLLYAGGFNVDFKDKNGETSLMRFASSYDDNNKVEIMRLLLEHGADPNVEDAEGIGLLNYGVYHNDTETVELLLEYGARINEKKLYGRTILDTVIIHNMVDTIKVLVPKITNKNDIDKLIIYALEYRENEYRISIEDRKDLVKLLLEHGADPNVEFEHFYARSTLLIRASVHGWVEIIKLLLDYGADVNAKDGYKMTALMSAINKQNPNTFDTVKILLDNGADVNAEASSRHGIPYTALTVAQTKGFDDIVELLIKRQKQQNNKRRNTKKKQTRQRKKLKSKRRRNRNKKNRKRSYKMRRRNKPKLKPLNIPKEEETFAYRMVINNLKFMNLEDVKKIYDEVVSVKPDKIHEYYNENCKRFMVDVNDGEIKFYKSTGDSRSTGLKDIWLPYDDCVFDPPKYVVSKPEDKFIIDFELKGMSSELLKDNFDDLNTYKRFINERTASISKWLYENK